MIITRVYLPSARTKDDFVAEYPDAIALICQDCIYIFDASIPPEERKRYAGGNWIACFTSNIIAWEFHQEEPNEHS